MLPINADSLSISGVEKVGASPAKTGENAKRMGLTVIIPGSVDMPKVPEKTDEIGPLKILESARRNNSPTGVSPPGSERFIKQGPSFETLSPFSPRNALDLMDQFFKSKNQ